MAELTEREVEDMLALNRAATRFLNGLRVDDVPDSVLEKMAALFKSLEEEIGDILASRRKTR